MASLALLGGGGFAKEIKELAANLGYTVDDYFADSPGDAPLKHSGYLEELLVRKSKYDGVALAIGGISRQMMKARRQLISWLEYNSFNCPTLVSKHAVIASGVSIGDGVYISHNAVIGIDAKIGSFSVINTAAIVSHDCVVGDNVSISPGAYLGGRVTVGPDGMIGAGAHILQGIHIGSEAMVGLGATVLRDLADRAGVLPDINRR